MNLDKQFTPETLIDRQFVRFINDEWTKNEFIYKNGSLTNINIYELMCNPVEDKPHFEIIKLSGEKYVELYFPFIEIKHSIPIFYKQEYKIKPHETTITKYIRCSKYISCNPNEGDIVCSPLINKNSGASCIIYNVLIPNKTKNFVTGEMIDNNSYRYSHSYYKTKYFEPDNTYESKVIIGKDNKDFTIVIRNVLSDITYDHNINNPITYVMGLDFDLYKELTN